MDKKNTPEVKLGQYKGLAVTRHVRPVTDKTVDIELVHQTRMHAVYHPTTEPAKRGFRALLDFAGYMDGKEIPDSRMEKVMVVLGDGKLMPAAEQAIYGHRAGEVFRFDFTYPQDFRLPELSGKTAQFEIELRSLAEKVTPAPDEAFARSLGFDSLDALKADLRAKKQKIHEEGADRAAGKQLLDMAGANMTVDLPAEILDRTAQNEMKLLKERLSRSGITLEQHCKNSRTTPEALEKDYRAQAESRIRFVLAAKAIAEQGADFVYTDEATFEGKVENVVLYHFKPDFMLDNLRSNNYICHLTLFSRRLMDAAGGPERMEYNGSQDYELFLRLTEQAEKIVHIPHALYYWRSSPGSTAADISAKTYCIDAGIAALKAHYARCGIAVDDVALIPGTPGYYKTDYTIEHPGRVSILIPTCDHIRDLELCVDSIYARTTYPDFELILIENNSKQPETFRAYERMQKEHPDNLKVVTWEGKGFNYSALNNFGEQYATGEYLLLLNNDTEVITPNWLEEMVMYAQQKRVGCVGAKLLYPDDTIQHAGIGFGIGGVAGHLHKYFPAASDGYMGRLNYVQDVYGDTAACLLIRREIYDEMNGLDESYAVAFNDVDFCVRVREAGYTNVFTPFAQLYHYESKSRGTEDNPEKQKRFQGEVLRFQARWGDLLAAGDPCTNPNFDIQREDFTLKILPLE